MESWDVLEGGENTVEGLTVLPGGMVPQVALGGIQKRSPLTVKRLWAESLIIKYKELDELAGQAECKVTYEVKNKRNSEATFTGSKITYSGVLGTVTRPNYDAMKSEAAYLQIMVDLSGTLS